MTNTMQSERERRTEVQAAIVDYLKDTSQYPKIALLLDSIKLRHYGEYSEYEVRSVLWKMLRDGEVDMTVDHRFKLNSAK